MYHNFFVSVEVLPISENAKTLDQIIHLHFHPLKLNVCRIDCSRPT